MDPLTREPQDVHCVLDLPISGALGALRRLPAGGPLLFGTDDSALLVYPAARPGRLMPPLHRRYGSLYTAAPRPRWFRIELTLEMLSADTTTLRLCTSALPTRSRRARAFSYAARGTLAELANALQTNAALMSGVRALSRAS